MEYLTLNNKDNKVNKVKDNNYYTYRNSKLSKVLNDRTRFKETRQSRKLKLERKLEKKEIKRIKNRNNCPHRYKTYIISKFWQERKNKYWQNNKRECRRCRSREHIIVHHAVYEKYGEEPDCNLFALCKSCHKEFHDRYGVTKYMLRKTKRFIEELYQSG